MSVLYQLKSDTPDGDIRGYLMGTIHLYHTSFDQLLQAVVEHLEVCQHYCPEMDMSHVNAGFSGGLHDVSQVPLQFKTAQLKFFLNHFNIDLRSLQSLPVSAVFGFLFSQLTHDLTAPGSIDQYLLEAAVSRKIPVEGLETVETQMDILKEIQDGSLLLQVQNLISQPLEFRKLTRRMIELYSQGDITQLYQRGKRQSGKDRKRLIYDRNRTMAQKYIELLAANPDDKIFAAVGCGHLPGQFGMLRILKKHGYRYEPIELPVP